MITRHDMATGMGAVDKGLTQPLSVINKLSGIPCSGP